MTKAGTLSVILPAPEWEGSMEALAQKDVPTGLKYKIVEDSELPVPPDFRNAWYVDEADLTDGVGADYGILEEAAGDT